MRATTTAIGALVALLAVAMVLGVGVAPAQARAPLDKRPFTVVAVVDTGINPYHVDFRAPELNQHPSNYITGFPREAKALRLSLTLDESAYPDALAKDKRKWDSFKRDQLYWIPGTNIVGAIQPRGATGGEFPDQDGHGTVTASLAGGRVHGPKTNDIVIVAVAGWLEGLEWAARQPWIDVVTNSFAWHSMNRRHDAEHSRAAVESGKLVCFASGNYVAPFWIAGTQGPSWSLNVGAASERSRGEHAYTSWPNDVLGFSGVKAADNQSIHGECGYCIGTSMAAPNVCGQAARVISDVRRALGDHREGTEDGLAKGSRRKGKYLEDGCLDRVELEDAIQATAVPAETAAPHPGDPLGIPAAPIAGFVRGGYGIVDHDSAEAALDVLLGRAARPERSIEDAWITHTDTLRDRMYGPPPGPVGCR